MSLTLLLLPLAVSSLPDTFLPGPDGVDYIHVNKEIFGSLDHALDIYAPHAAGPAPVVVFFTGLSGMAPGWAYSGLLTHIASWGYVVISPSALLYNPAETYKAEWVEPVLQWAGEHLAPGGSLHSSLHPDLELDMEHLYLGSHSSGGHVAVEFLKLGCHDVQALFLLSPVDGFDPFGLVPIYCITPGELLPFQTPSLIVNGGLDTVPGIGPDGGLFPACAPVDLGADRFYRALGGPTLLVNTTDFGHADLLDELEADANQWLSFCKTDKEQDRTAYRQELGGQVVSFLRYILGECSLLGVMVGDEASGTGVATENMWKNGMEAACGAPGCSGTR